MAEFQFPCPQCRQQIVCDVTYAGVRINCPSCQQAIIVPPTPPAPPAVTPPPAPGVVQIKVSTLRNVAIIGLCVLLAAGLVLTAIHFLAGSKTLTFKASVDGSDIVKLQGKKLWIEHQAWQKPKQIAVNGKKWNPSWDGNTSAPYALGSNFRPHDPAKIQLTKKAGRGNITILEKPGPQNDQTLSIKVDDGPQPGADGYEFVVSW